MHPFQLSKEKQLIKMSIISEIEKYSNSFDKIDEFRQQGDLVLKIMWNPQVAKPYLIDGLNMIKILYGDRLESDSIKEFELVIQNIEEDICSAHTFWIFVLALCAPISNWFINGSEQTPAPDLADRDGLQTLLLKYIPAECESLLSGKHNMDIESFIRNIRAQYLANCGVPLPPSVSNVFKRKRDLL